MPRMVYQELYPNGPEPGDDGQMRAGLLYEGRGMSAWYLDAYIAS